MLETLSLAATALAVVGVVLNNRRRRACFWLWWGSNALTLGIHLAAGLWCLAARDAIFLGLAVQGWIVWGRAERSLAEVESMLRTKFKSRKAILESEVDDDATV